MDSIQLAFSHERWFKLDTLFNSRTFSVQVYPKENPNFLLYHHAASNMIGVYDLHSGKLISTIKFRKEGENGVGTGVRAIHFVSFDSIYLFSPLAQQLYLADSSGTLKNRYDLLNKKYYALLGTTYPAFIRNNRIHFCAYPSPEQKPSSSDFSLLWLNLTTSEVGYSVNLSKEYDRGFWGKHNYLRPHHLFNEVKKVFIANFPNDHFIYLMHRNGSFQKYFAGAKRIGYLNPVSEAYTDDDAKAFALEAKQGFYSALFYDRWRNLYYRIAHNPTEDSSESRSDFGQISIILLDENLKKVGESYLPKDTYVIGASFITPEGLFLFNERKYDKNDDYLIYDIYKIQKRE